MPRGKYTNHKGKHRRFTNPEEIEEQMKREEKERKWRQERGDASSSEEEEEGAGASKKGNKSGSSSESSEEESSEEEAKAKGVGSLIEIQNPNRVQQKSKKLTNLNDSVKAAHGKPELSRKEREELDRQRAHANYQRLHAEGKTDEARADLARLAIIKQQRAEAALRREEEQKKRDDAKQTKTAQTQKALGKKTT